MVQIVGNIRAKSRNLFKIGRIGFGVMIMAYGIATATNLISQNEDFKQYTNFWQVLYGESDLENKFDQLARENQYFDLIRFLTSMLYMLAGAFVITDKIYGALLTIISLVINSFFYANPLIFEDYNDQQ